MGGQRKSWLCFLSYCEAPRNVQTPKKPRFLCSGSNPFPSLPVPVAPRSASPFPHFNNHSENSSRESEIQDILIKEYVLWGTTPRKMPALVGQTSGGGGVGVAGRLIQV